MNLKRPILLLLLAAVLPASAEAPPWYFEFENGRPVKLIWQTEPGKSYNLRQSDSLLSWTQAPGFPKAAAGTQMEYPFVPAQRGYFDIRTVAAAGGGWRLVPLPGLEAGSYYQIQAVSALDATQIWASGNVKPMYDPCVLRSNDGGQTWTQTFRGSGIGFFGEIQMVTPEIGYVAGGGVRRTTDGGVTWPADPVNPDGYMYGMAVVDQDHVWLGGWDGAGAGVIHHRVPERPANPTPGSNWWLEWAMSSRAMYGVSAVNQNTAWAVGYAGFIWKTTDGQGWGPQTSNTGVPLNDVDAVDASTVYVVGDGGTILKTTDGGTVWLPQSSGTTEHLRRIAAVSATAAWAVGEGGVILHTSDGGTTWTRQFSGTGATLLGVAAVDADTAWVGGEGLLMRTTDGGTGAWAPPAITGVSPGVVGAYSWPQKTVSIFGSGFRGGNVDVRFGTIPADGVTWINESTLQAVAPIGISGTHPLTVTNEDGQQATLARAVTFLPSPVITRYSPLHAPAAGGYQITVDGYNLQSVNRATFSIPGNPESLPVTVVDSTRVLITVSASATRAPGLPSFYIETTENQNVSGGYFQFDPAGGPAFAVSSLSPASAPAFSPFTLTVTGAGFTADTTLELCDRAVNITSWSPTQVVGQAYGSSPGLCRLVVVKGETDGLHVDPAFLLTSSPMPEITQISTAAGPSAGGTSVTITGTGFSDTDTVTFGGYEAAITSRSASFLVVTTPPHGPGAVGVFVMTEDLGRSVAMLSNAFTYR